MIKYCIWDVGQTIYPYSLDPLDKWAREKTTDIEKYEKSGGVKAFDYKNYMRGYENNDRFISRFCRSLFIPYTSKTKIEINKEFHRGAGNFFPQTLEAMKIVEQNGGENGLLSNALPLLCDTVGFIKPEYSFPSYLIGFLKPEKDAYETVKYALKCDYSEMLFVDDKPQNVAAAKELGIHGIVYNKDTIIQDITAFLAKENNNTILLPQTNRNR